MCERQTRMSPVLQCRCRVGRPFGSDQAQLSSLPVSRRLTLSLARQMGTGLGTLDQVPRAKRRRRCRLRAWSLGTRASRVESWRYTPRFACLGREMLLKSNRVHEVIADKVAIECTIQLYQYIDIALSYKAKQGETCTSTTSPYKDI